MRRLPPHSKLVLFAPMTNHVEHSELEHFVGNEFNKLGAQVWVVRCRGAFQPKCLGMTRKPSDSASRLLDCADCRFRSSRKANASLYKTIFVEDYLTSEDYRKTTEFLDQAERHDWINLEFEGIPFGRFWAYHTAVEFKTVNFNDNAEALDDFWESARGHLLSYLAAKSIKTQIGPDAALTYSFEYPLNRSFLAGLGDTPGYSIGHGWASRRYSSVFFYRATKFQDVFEDPRASDMASTPLSLAELRDLKNNLMSSIRAKNLFSYTTPLRKQSRQSILSSLNLDSSRQIVLALTSSPDEVDAGNLSLLRPDHRLLDDDLDLVRIVTRLASEMVDVQFILRLHPRLFPNTRDRRTSSRAESVLEGLRETDNLKINRPDDSISLWDLVGVADAAISTRSSAGWEIGSVGIPVVFTDPSRDPKGWGREAEKDGVEGSSSYTLQILKSKVEEALQKGLDSSFGIQLSRFLASFTIRQAVPIYGDLVIPIAEKVSYSRRLLLKLLRNWAYRLGRAFPGMANGARELVLIFEEQSFRYPKVARLPSPHPHDENPISVAKTLEAFVEWHGVGRRSPSSENRRAARMQKRLHKLLRKSHLSQTADAKEKLRPWKKRV